MINVVALGGNVYVYGYINPNASISIILTPSEAAQVGYEMSSASERAVLQAEEQADLDSDEKANAKRKD